MASTSGPTSQRSRTSTWSAECPCHRAYGDGAPGTATEALAGLTRIRPDGWLDTPLPDNPGSLLLRAREAMDADQPGFNGRLRLISSRYTAAVFTVNYAWGLRVLKLHADPAGFAGEALAYELLTGTAPVAQLHAENEASLSLLLEYLG